MVSNSHPWSPCLSECPSLSGVRERFPSAFWALFSSPLAVVLAPSCPSSPPPHSVLSSVHCVPPFLQLPPPLASAQASAETDAISALLGTPTPFSHPHGQGPPASQGGCCQGRSPPPPVSIRRGVWGAPCLLVSCAGGDAPQGNAPEEGGPLCPHSRLQLSITCWGCLGHTPGAGGCFPELQYKMPPCALPVFSVGQLNFFPPHRASVWL